MASYGSSLVFVFCYQDMIPVQAYENKRVMFIWNSQWIKLKKALK